MLWIRTRKPIKPRGVASKLKGPMKASQAERRGAMVDWRRRLRESSVCGGEFVPQVVWEGWGDAGEDTEEVCLEGSDGTFGYVAAMNIWRY